MHLEEMLNTASQLIFELTGKDLTDLQTGLLKASWRIKHTIVLPKSINIIPTMLRM